MFYLRTHLGAYYNGRAGQFWLSETKADAFPYFSRAEAERRCAMFNARECLTGLVFTVEEG